MNTRQFTRQSDKERPKHLQRLSARGCAQDAGCSAVHCLQTNDSKRPLGGGMLVGPSIVDGIVWFVVEDLCSSGRRRAVVPARRRRRSCRTHLLLITAIAAAPCLLLLAPLPCSISSGGGPCSQSGAGAGQGHHALQITALLGAGGTRGNLGRVRAGKY